MNESASQYWTIDELASRAAEALEQDNPRQSNGQVREVPDTRTIRYYTQLGLLDRPALMRGRTGLYAPRHLCQLVAIKRLQASGLSLSAIQQQLLGRTDSELTTIARLPEPLATPIAAPPQPRRSADFWAHSPAPVAPRRIETNSAELPAHDVPLSDKVTLIICPKRPLDDNEIKIIRDVTEPLLMLMKGRGLI